MEFSNQEGIIIVDQLIQMIQENRDYLSEIDGAIGDGDHGVNMSKGFTMAEEELKDTSVNMSQGFQILSSVLMSKIGGSMGPLYGSLFRGLSTASKKADMINEEVLSQMWGKALQNIMGISPAQPGDKTLMDVLIPSVEAYQQAILDGKNMQEGLSAMVEASKEGVESTKHMVAKLGRASRLGEKSLGHQDAGATSCALIIQSIATSIQSLI